MPAGRPLELTSELLGKAKVYLDTCQDSLDAKIKNVNLPSVEGFASFLSINKTTVYEWDAKDVTNLPEETAQLFREFSNVFREILQAQAKRLINHGLAGNYNHVIAKLILSKHGYVDESKTDHTSGGEKIQGVVVLPKKDESSLASPTKTGDSA